MQSSNKFKPARSCLCCRRQNRSMFSKPKNRHSYEVNQTWRKLRTSFKKLNLKGHPSDVCNSWIEAYESSAYMPYTD